MVEDRIGHRYAKSLYELAQDQGVLEQARNDMALIKQACDDSRELALFLKSPLVYASKKEEVLAKVFEGKFETDFSQRLVSILAKKSREMFLPYVAKAFLDLYDQANNILRGLLTTAIPLSEAQQTAIQQAVSAKTGATFEVTQEVNPDLIGGFTLKIGDELFDGSTASAIRRIKRELLQE